MKTIISTAPRANSASYFALLASYCFLFILITIPLTSYSQITYTPRNEFENLKFTPVLLLEEDGVLVPSTSAVSSLNEDIGTETPQELLLRVSELQNSIPLTLQNEGVYSVLAKEQYEALGLAQQEIGRHYEAVENFEAAVHIARVNNGLFTEDQIDSINNILTSLVTLQDSKREAEYRGYLYYIQGKAYEQNDPKMLVAINDWADWNLKAYQKGFNNNPNLLSARGSSRQEEYTIIREHPSGLMLFVPRNSLRPSMDVMLPEHVIDPRFKEASKSYRQILEEESFNLSPQDEEEIKFKLISSNYLLHKHMELLSDISSMPGLYYNPRIISPVYKAYKESRELLESIIEKRTVQDASDLNAIAEAYQHLGDLHISYGYLNRARDAYKEAWQLTASLDGTDNFKEDSTLSPLMITPNFVEHLYFQNNNGLPASDNRGYIDASFIINNDGGLRKIRVLQSSDDTPYDVRKILLEQLRLLTVRPTLEEGKPVDSELQNMRFYYTY